MYGQTSCPVHGNKTREESKAIIQQDARKELEQELAQLKQANAELEKWKQRTELNIKVCNAEWDEDKKLTTELAASNAQLRAAITSMFKAMNHEQLAIFIPEKTNAAYVEVKKALSTPPADALKPLVEILSRFIEETETCLSNAHWEVKFGSGDLRKTINQVRELLKGIR